MTGPLPPAVGGMATLIHDLSRSSLETAVSLVLFNTGKTTPPGRAWHQGIASRVRVLRDWWRLLRASRGAVVHIHTCSGLTFFLDGMLLLIARWCHHPVVLHIHGGFFDQFLDGLNVPLLWAARRISRLADRVVVLSEEWRTRLSGRLPGTAIVVVQNGIPLSGDPSLSHPHDSGRVRVLYLGGLSANKGLFELVRAISELPADLLLVIAGAESEPGFSGRLQDECRRLGLESRTEFVGQVSGQNKADCFRNADVFVLPSHAEGLPISMLEAMGAGLPVVVSRVGGIPSVVEDGVHGLIVPPGEVEPLRRALSELAGDPRKRAEMAQACRQRIVDRFDIERTAETLLQLYRSVGSARTISQSHPSPASASRGRSQSQHK